MSSSHAGGTPHDPGPRRAGAHLDPWFHNLHLPDGRETRPGSPLGDFPRNKWLQLAPHLPADLGGWSALDVGCNAGFYSFELARRGAQVTAIDADPRYLQQARWARDHYPWGRQVRFEQAQVFELARRDETWDLVLFMGLFYHLRYPVLALDLLARRTRRLLVFQTLSMPGQSVADPRPTGIDDDIRVRDEWLQEGWPKMAFIEHDFVGDPTNWWAPNHAACEALLRTAGMRIVGRPLEEIYLCEPDPERLAERERYYREQLEAIFPAPR